MKSINQLSTTELKTLINKGYLSYMNNIYEMGWIYDRVKEELKRRELKLKEIQKTLPTDRYFKVETRNGAYFYQVVDCKEAPKGIHITHYCKVIGFIINDNKLKQFNNYTDIHWQINGSVEFGWDGITQQMIYWIKGDFAPYETIEITEQKYQDYIYYLESFGFSF